MKIILLHQKSEWAVEMQDWRAHRFLDSYNWLYDFLPGGLLGGSDPVFTQTLRCHSTETPPNTDEPTLVLVHASDTSEWGVRDLDVDKVRQHFQFSELLAVLPVTSQSASVDIDLANGRMQLYGIADLKRLVDHLLAGGILCSEEELRKFLEAGVDDHLHEVLAALMILCEGYLAVHAACDESLEELEEALVAMGWRILMKESPDLIDPEILRGKCKEVSASHWWRQVFPGRLKPSRTWPAAGAVQRLIDCIYEAEVVKPADVAQAYLELARIP